jgi:hypothetical protein
MARRLASTPDEMDWRAAGEWIKKLEAWYPSWRIYRTQNRPREWWLHVYFGPTDDGPQEFLSRASQCRALLNKAMSPSLGGRGENPSELPKEGLRESW